MPTVKTNTEYALRSRLGAIYGNFFGALPNPDPILRNAGKSITVYRDLCYDAHVAACVNSRRSGVLSMEWAIDRGAAKSRQAKFLEKIFAGLDIQQILSEMLDGALFGYAVSEVVWRKDGAAIVPDRVTGKPQEWFGFDDENRLVMFSNRDITGEIVPPYKFVVTTSNATYDNPYGFAALAPCFWPYTFKKGGLKFWAVYTEKYGMPHVVGKYPAHTSQEKINDMLESLQKMVQDAIAVIPVGSELDILNTNSKDSNDIFESLQHYSNSEMSKALLGQTLTTEIGETGGAYAASETHNAIRGEIVDSDRRMVERSVNQLIRWVIDINFGAQREYPRFEMYQEEDVDTTLAERDKKLAEIGVKFKSSYISKAYGIDEADFDINTPEPEAAPAPGAPELKDKNRTGRDFAEVPTLEEIENRALDLEAKQDETIDAIRAMVESAESLEDLRDKLDSEFGDLPTGDLVEIMAEAFTAAELLGRYDVGSLL